MDFKGTQKDLISHNIIPNPDIGYFVSGDTIDVWHTPYIPIHTICLRSF